MAEGQRTAQRVNIKKIKNFIKKTPLFGVIKFILKIRAGIREKWRKNKIRRTELNKNNHRSFGKLNPDKKLYIIRREAPGVGLFSYFITTLGGIAFAEQNGMVPVVDMKNNSNTYLSEEEVGKANAWEFFFLQPGGYRWMRPTKAGMYS